MNRMKRVVLLLLVAVGSNAETEPTPPTGPDHCDGPKSKMQLTDLHKLKGEWELAWSVSNSVHGNGVMSDTKSSHIDFNCDNKTMYWTEKNDNRVAPDNHYIINVELPSSHGDAAILADDMISVVNGTNTPYNGTAVMTFYVSCPDCMVVTYEEGDDRFLLYYMRNGDWDAETVQKDLKKRAKCLGFGDNPVYSHDVFGGFAHKISQQSAPEDASKKDK